MHLLEVVIMSSSINQLSMLLLRSSAVNICQCCVRFCIHHHLSVVARTFMEISLGLFLSVCFHWQYIYLQNRCYEYRSARGWTVYRIWKVVGLSVYFTSDLCRVLISNSQIPQENLKLRCERTIGLPSSLTSTSTIKQKQEQRVHSSLSAISR